MENKDFIERDLFVKSGKKGGDTTASKVKEGTLNKDHFKTAGKKGMQVRWGKKKDTTI